jgi:hypothetical protein
MRKYGIEVTSKGSSKIIMYKNDEQAKTEAEEMAATLPTGETLMLFTAECDDEGKLASNLRHVVKTWQH